MNPITKYPWFSIIFAIIAIVDIVGIVAYPQVRLVSKGMIMASLLALYILQAKRQEHSVLLGIIFALLGDAFLLFTTDDFFLIGLGCFLIMQLCYSTTFWRKRRIPRTRDKVIVGLIALLPIAFLTGSWSQLAGMQVAVTIYAAAITTMLITAYLRHPRLGGYWFVLVGSVLFVMSDMMLAIDKFVLELSQGGLAVMITYMAAQYLIITGLLMDQEARANKQKTQAQGTFSRHKG